MTMEESVMATINSTSVKADRAPIPRLGMLRVIIVIEPVFAITCSKGARVVDAVDARPRDGYGDLDHAGLATRARSDGSEGSELLGDLRTIGVDEREIDWLAFGNEGWISEIGPTHQSKPFDFALHDLRCEHAGAARVGELEASLQRDNRGA